MNNPSPYFYPFHDPAWQQQQQQQQMAQQQMQGPPPGFSPPVASSEVKRKTMEQQLHSLLGLSVASSGSSGVATAGLFEARAVLAEELEQQQPPPPPPPSKETRQSDESRDANQSKESSPKIKAEGAARSKQDRGQKRSTGKLRMSHATSEEVSAAVIKLYESKRLTEQEIAARKATVARLQRVVEELFPNRGAQLQLFGSSVNGFGVTGSDMDMVLMLEPDPKTDGNDKHPQANLVEKVAGALTALQYGELLAIPTARVPVVKFRDPATGLGCDICFNNALALRNSMLLATYAELDPRVKLLAFAVKNWAKNRRVNTTFEGTLSSYAYVLMVIHFLQGRRPPVVPVLQEMSPLRGRNKKKVMVAGYDTYFYQNLEDKRLLEFGAQNTESVGTLLFEFFIFYGFYFQYKDKVISPRTGRTLTKEDKGWTQPVDKANKSNYWFCLEDPFELGHNLGRTVDKGSLFNLRYEFRRGASILAGTFPWEEAYLDKARSSSMEMLMTPFSKLEKTVKL